MANFRLSSKEEVVQAQQAAIQYPEMFWSTYAKESFEWFLQAYQRSHSYILLTLRLRSQKVKKGRKQTKTQSFEGFRLAGLHPQ